LVVEPRSAEQVTDRRVLEPVVSAAKVLFVRGVKPTGLREVTRRNLAGR
jgi:hypothetical protein